MDPNLKQIKIDASIYLKNSALRQFLRSRFGESHNRPTLPLSRRLLCFTTLYLTRARMGLHICAKRAHNIKPEFIYPVAVAVVAADSLLIY